MPLTSSPQQEIIHLRVSADGRFKDYLNRFNQDFVDRAKASELTKISEFSNVEWCVLYLVNKAHEKIRSGPEPQIDVKAAREYIVDTYADEGVDHWNDVFDQAITILEELNLPYPDSP